MPPDCIDCGQRPQATRHGLCAECSKRWSEKAGRVEPEPEETGGQVTLEDF